jgi:hypothetical protein
MASVNPYNTEVNSVTGNGKKYPNPFFDLANNHLPSNIKSLFRYCRTFFQTDTFLSNVVRKLTEYPITDILYPADIEDKQRESWDEALHGKLKIKKFLIEMGLDYYTYGNSFVSVIITSKRVLQAPDGSTLDFATTDYEYIREEFYPILGGRKSTIPYKLVDIPVKSLDNFKIIRWNPENIDIDYNPVTGTSTYYYNMPNALRNKILKGDKGALLDIPLIMLEGAKKNKSLRLDPNSLYHFKRPGLAEDDMAWGKPLILPAIKKIYYLQTLQRGNEAVAHEHIVPKKVISPAANGAVDPFASMNMSKWTGEVESQIKKWRADPNHIAVFPIPMQYQELGGNARALLLTQEMSFLEEIIINSLGVPLEFIKGGASWTGSTVSLRIVENMFLGYRTQLEEFLNHFLLPKIKAHMSYPDLKIHFKKFKMADDNQTKQLAVQLAQLGKISDTRILDEFGYNPNEEFELLKQDRQTSLDAKIAMAKAEAESQGEGEVTLAKYRIRAQAEGEWEAIRIKVERLEKELNQEQGNTVVDPVALVERTAIAALQMDANQQNSFFTTMAQKTPVLYSFVMERIQSIMQTKADLQEPATSKNNNKNAAQAPGSREGDKVQISEKTRGNTRGQPTD